MLEKNQADKARQEIERMIVFGELDIRILYSENKLATMLNLGRTPIREALQSLEKDNMLIVHPRKGIEFLSISPEQQVQLLEVRRHVEALCIQYAIKRSTFKQKKEMLALAERIYHSAERKDQADILYCLQNIHSLLCESTQNPYFAHALSQIQFFSRRFWFASKKEGDEIKAAKMHRQILISVAVGNEKRALRFSQLLMEHLTSSCFNPR